MISGNHKWYSTKEWFLFMISVNVKNDDTLFLALYQAFSTSYVYVTEPRHFQKQATFFYKL